MAENEHQWIAFFDAADIRVGISLTDLEKYPVDDIIYALSMDLAPLDTWRRVAVEYHKRAKYTDFEIVLENATSARAHEAYRNGIRDSDYTEFIKERKTRELAEEETKIHTALAAHMIKRMVDKKRQMCEVPDDRKKAIQGEIREHEMTVTGLIDKATGIRNDIYPGTHVCRGLLFLLKQESNIEEAERCFQLGKSDDGDFIPALLGLACTQFHRKKYESALKWYQKALITNAEACAPSVRVGVGFCLFRLRRFVRAREAFERALALDPNNVEAMAGLATVLINNKGIEEGAMAKAVKLLNEAYARDSTNPMVLNLLAFVLFYQDRHEDLNTLASRAFRVSQSTGCKAEALYQMARLKHAHGRPSEANRLYLEATSLDPKHALAQFGLAQTLVLNGEESKAIEILRTLRKRGYVSHHANRILGTLYIQQAKEKKGKRGANERMEKLVTGQKFLMKALKHFPEDESILTELAEACEETNAQDSYNYYKKAMKCLTKKGEMIPFQLWNNLGVLCQRLHKNDEARKAFEAAQILSKQQQGKDEKKTEGSGSDDSALVTITYNKALLNEQEDRMKEAAKVYKMLIERYPHYVDAHLRLGCESRADGRYEEAEEHFRKALKLEPENQDAKALIGSLYIDMGALDKAEACFEEMLSVSKHDAYAKLSLADIHVRRMNKLNGLKADPVAVQKMQSHFNKAKEIFLEVLKANPNNMYAGNGFGIVFSHLQKWNEAKQTLQQVKDANKNNPAVHINLGHVYTQLSMYPNAIGAYEVALKEYPRPEDRVEILTYIARAQYLASNTEQCKRTLIKALHLAPTDSILKYNLGVTLEDHAVRVFGKNTQDRTLAEVRQAYREFKQAVEVFEDLCARLNASEEEADKALADKAVNHHKFCQGSLNAGGEHLKEAERRDEEVQKKRKKAEENAERLRRHQAEEQRKRKEEEEAKQRQMEEHYRAARQRVEEGLANEQMPVENAARVATEDTPVDKQNINSNEKNEPETTAAMDTESGKNHEDQDQKESPKTEQAEREGIFEENEGGTAAAVEQPNSEANGDAEDDGEKERVGGKDDANEEEDLLAAELKTETAEELKKGTAEESENDHQNNPNFLNGKRVSERSDADETAPSQKRQRIIEETEDE